MVPSVAILENAMLAPQAAAAARGAARAALAQVQGRSAERRSAFETAVQFRIFQRGVAAALSSRAETTKAAAVLAAVDIGGAIAASGLDPSCLAISEASGMDSMIAHICVACGAQRDAVVVAALGSLREAADET